MQCSNDNPNVLGLSPSATNWSDIPNATISVAGAGTYLIPKFDICYDFLRLVYTSTATGVQTALMIADTGAKQVQTVTTVADTAGNLNNTFFLLSSVNTTTKAQKNFYLWMDNGTGVDPAIAGRTGIHVTYTDGDSANANATAIRAALNALTGDFVATGAGAAVIITNVAFGLVTAAADGAVPTGFTFGAATPGVASNLNNKYFYLNSANAGVKYVVYMNVDGIGTAPVIAGYTALSTPLVSGDTAAAVGTALATAVDATATFVATGTTTVTITNSASGPFTPITDTGLTGFTFAVTTPTGVVSAYLKTLSM
jgi:hypothetical protein